MKYYSENLKKLFDSEEDLKKAEETQKAEDAKKAELSATKKQRAEEIEAAYKQILSVRQGCMKQIQDADDKYNKLVDAFVKDFGSYHFTYDSTNVQEPVKVSDVVDKMFDAFDMLPFIW